MENLYWILKMLIMLNACLKLWKLVKQKNSENVQIIRGHPSYYIMIISTALLNFQVIIQNNIQILKCCSCYRLTETIITGMPKSIWW